MTNSKKPSAAGMMEFVRQESERIVGSCIQCGSCFDVCPMTKYGGLDREEIKGTDVVGGILAVLRGEQGNPESLAWSRVCMASGECVPACPEQVNPLLMVRLARMIASGGTGANAQMRLNDDLGHFPRMRAYARMQLSPDEIKEWL